MINPIYLKEKTIPQLRHSLQDTKQFPAILLLQFFDPTFYSQLQRDIIKIQLKHETEPLTHSYATALLPKLWQESLDSPEIITFLQKLLNKTINGIDWQIFCFSWKDYTILNDKELQEPGIEFIIDITPDWPEQAGGDIYYSDGKGEYIKLSLAKNTAAIVKCKKGVSRFVKYVNIFAGKKRRYLLIGRVI